MARNPQEQDAWIKKRVGKATASRMGAIIKRAKAAPHKPLKAYQDYLHELVLERLTGNAMDHFVSDAMVRGTELEPEAVAAYEFERGIETAFSDFVDHPLIGMSGASPDRLVGEDGLLEIKCPMPKNHIDFILHGEVPEDYLWQCVWQMAVTGRQWCDLMYYHPDFPIHLQSRTVRIRRDIEEIERAESAVTEFLGAVASRVSELEALDPQERAA